jgi:hypothetical protein
VIHCSHLFDRVQNKKHTRTQERRETTSLLPHVVRILSNFIFATRRNKEKVTENKMEEEGETWPVE